MAFRHPADLCLPPVLYSPTVQIFFLSCSGKKARGQFFQFLALYWWLFSFMKNPCVYLDWLSKKQSFRKTSSNEATSYDFNWKKRSFINNWQNITQHTSWNPVPKWFRCDNKMWLYEITANFTFVVKQISSSADKYAFLNHFASRLLLPVRLVSLRQGVARSSWVLLTKLVWPLRCSGWWWGWWSFGHRLTSSSDISRCFNEEKLIKIKVIVG